MLTNRKQEDGNKPVSLNHSFGGIADLSPSYFAMVMATGIVSVAAHLYNYTLLSRSLFYINIIAYIVICVLFLGRFIFYKKEFISDFRDDEKNMGFLSFVAASCILGSQFVLIADNYQIGIYFLILGLASGIILTYLLLAILIEKRNKPSLQAINDSWLLLVVAMQAVSVLSAQLEAFLPFPQGEVLFFSLMMFLCGSIFYIIIITLIVYRLIFFKLQAENFGPSYWINMGADAITVLAGSTLILNVHKWQILSDIISFLKGYTLLFWAIGTWWIPLIVILGLWRHITKKIPLRYHSQYWEIIFPLGMYTVCTVYLAQAIDLPFLKGISSVFVFFAIAGWTIVFISLLYSMAFKTKQKGDLKSN